MMNKTIYYILSFTWGIMIAAAGALVALGLVICGYHPVKNIYGWAFFLPGNFGGLSLGPFCFVSTSALLEHEFGHSIQNCWFGPFMLFIVMIPSAIRYWYREFNHITNPSYDAIWFEGQATKLGNKYKEFSK